MLEVSEGKFRDHDYSTKVILRKKGTRALTHFFLWMTPGMIAKKNCSQKLEFFEGKFLDVEVPIIPQKLF